MPGAMSEGSMGDQSTVFFHASQQLASHEWPVHEILPLQGVELETARSQAEALSTRPSGHVNSVAFSRYKSLEDRCLGR